MGNQATRGTLEAAAKTVRMQANELSTKGLDGKMISATPQGQKIDQLNWNAGIKFSLIKNRPKFFDPESNSTMSLGEIIVLGAQLESTTNISDYINNDVFLLMRGGATGLSLCIPPFASTYMIAIHAKKVWTMIPGNAIEVIIQGSSAPKTLDVVPLTAGDGFVGMAMISPAFFKQAFGACDIIVNFPVGIAFGGITITRL